MYDTNEMYYFTREKSRIIEKPALAGLRSELQCQEAETVSLSGASKTLAGENPP